tara:strand:+ start:98 stop:340 length:243 start_codon:yes stop_codon:yes gene_type:complete
MDIMSGIVVFATVWWITFLMALPFGAQPVHSPEQGHDHGAPKKSHLKIKLLVTTLITIILWFGIEHLININFIDFRAMAG